MVLHGYYCIGRNYTAQWTAKFFVVIIMDQIIIALKEINAIIQRVVISLQGATLDEWTRQKFVFVIRKMNNLN